MTVISLSLLTLLVVLATTLPLLRCSHWVVRGLDFPRMQLAVIAAAVLLAQCLLLDTASAPARLMIAATALCLLWQLRCILPYTPLWRREVKPAGNHDADREISILTANVLTTNRNAGPLLALVQEHAPDILVTMESDQWWQEELEALEDRMPFSVKCPLDNLYGMHLYSRLPLGNEEVCYLVEDDVPSIHATIELGSGETVRAHFLHPAPPSPTENTESAERDAELVIVARSVAESDLPVIVAGDLNDVAWSATTRLFRKISGLLDPRVGRGAFNTFHVNYPFLRWPLDHLFHSQHFTLVAMQRLPDIGSDHFPLLTRLTFTPIRGADQDGLDAGPAEQQRAREIAENKGVSKSDVPTPSTPYPDSARLRTSRCPIH
jgi:endonuclease/exonuclease/phosphatase (EEP) superfamily protein YafD